MVLRLTIVRGLPSCCSCLSCHPDETCQVWPRPDVTTVRGMSCCSECCFHAVMLLLLDLSHTPDVSTRPRPHVCQRDPRISLVQLLLEPFSPRFSIPPLLLEPSPYLNPPLEFARIPLPEFPPVPKWHRPATQLETSNRVPKRCKYAPVPARCAKGPGKTRKGPGRPGKPKETVKAHRKAGRSGTVRTKLGQGRRTRKLVQAGTHSRKAHKKEERKQDGAHKTWERPMKPPKTGRPKRSPSGKEGPTGRNGQCEGMANGKAKRRTGRNDQRERRMRRPDGEGPKG